MKNTDLSPFAQLALKLDQDFGALERLSGQIERLDIETDNGLEQALKLLGQFAKHGESISAGIQDFAGVLDQSRARAEQAAAIVSERAALVQKRHQEQSELQGRFNQLAAKVQEVNASLSAMKKPDGAFTEAEKAQLTERLQAMDAHLGVFVEEAGTLRAEADRANLKKLGRNAESLQGTLIAARTRLSSVFASR